MKKIMIATLGLSLLSGTAVFAQNSSAGAGQSNGGTMDSGSSTGKHKKHKKSKKSDNAGTDSSTAAPKQ